MPYKQGYEFNQQGSEIHCHPVVSSSHTNERHLGERSKKESHLITMHARRIRSACKEGLLVKIILIKKVCS